MPQPDLALQGNLFGDAEPARSAPSKSQKKEHEPDPLDDLELTQDAKQRPRQRQEQQHDSEPSATSQSEPEPKDTPANGQNDDDLPPWSHHSQVTPQQLTPMLRHYVELKAAHPERVLLYRLGDFLSVFLKTPSNCLVCLNSRSRAKRQENRLDECPWLASPITLLSGTAQS